MPDSYSSSVQYIVGKHARGVARLSSALGDATMTNSRATYSTEYKNRTVQKYTEEHQHSQVYSDTQRRKYSLAGAPADKVRAGQGTVTRRIMHSTSCR